MAQFSTGEEYGAIYPKGSAKKAVFDEIIQGSERRRHGERRSSRSTWVVTRRPCRSSRSAADHTLDDDRTRLRPVRTTADEPRPHLPRRIHRVAAVPADRDPGARLLAPGGPPRPRRAASRRRVSRASVLATGAGTRSASAWSSTSPLFIAILFTVRGRGARRRLLPAMCSVQRRRVAVVAEGLLDQHPGLPVVRGHRPRVGADRGASCGCYPTGPVPRSVSWPRRTATCSGPSPRCSSS